MDNWVACNMISSELLRGEQIYRVRRHDGSVVEGYTIRKYLSPSFHVTLQQKSKKLGTKDITALWGYIVVDVLEKGPEKTLVAFSDNQVALVNNSRVLSKLPEYSGV